LVYNHSDAIDDVDLSLIDLVSCDAPPLDASFSYGQLKEGAAVTLKAPVFPVQSIRREDPGKSCYHQREKSNCELCYLTVDIRGAIYDTEVMLDTTIDESMERAHLTLFSCRARTLAGPSKALRTGARERESAGTLGTCMGSSWRRTRVFQRIDEWVL
jgi:hypothetical protein